MNGMHGKVSGGGECWCPVCRRETLVLREAVYEGFARVGERCRCLTCGHEHDAAEGGARDSTEKTPSVFSGEDYSPEMRVFDPCETARLCRHCADYVVNPFRQWCARRQCDVEATDSCPDFRAKVSGDREEMEDGRPEQPDGEG